MTERRIWLAVEIAVELVLVMMICLIASAMVGGSSFVEALHTLRELL